MPFIDWSDAEGMFDLMVEFIKDEWSVCIHDSDRQRFLASLLADLNAANAGLDTMTVAKAIHHLQGIHDSIDEEFRDDPVVVHLRHCIDELERLA